MSEVCRPSVPLPVIYHISFCRLRGYDKATNYTYQYSSEVVLKVHAYLSTLLFIRLNNPSHLVPVLFELLRVVEQGSIVRKRWNAF